MWPKNAHLKHGDSRVGKRTPEYRAWAAMKDRCSNPKTKCYPNYGGRNIKVCDRWKDSFVNFLTDMGRKPSLSHSLDRIKNDGNYEPDNCRWATRSQQCYNRTVGYKITMEDAEEIRDLYNSAYEPTQRDLAKQFNVDPSEISRILSGKRRAYAS